MKWSVGFKIGSGFVFAAIVMVVLGAFAYSNTTRLIERQSELARTERTLSTIHSITANLSAMESAARGYIITAGAKYLEPYHANLNTISQQMKELAQLTDDTPEQKRSVEALQGLIAEKLDLMKKAVEMRDQQGLDEVIRMMSTGANRSVMEDIMKNMAKIENIEAEQGKRWDEQARASIRSTTATVLYGIPVCLVLLALVGFALTRNISRPLNRMSRVAEKMAVGDLSLEIKDTGRQDEVGILEHAFKELESYQREMSELTHRIASGNLTVDVKPRSEKDLLGHAAAAMVEKLRQQIRKMTEGVNFLASAAGEIMATTSQVASAATETSTAVAETTATIEELRQTVQVSSQKAKDVSQNAQHAAQTSQSGKAAVETAVEGMTHIRLQMDSIAQSIVKLSEQSQTIGDIISSVSDIADQSNLLAVNASIEAAKAGEHGRGFAVVAQEVRVLAEQSKQATTQIRAILNEIQKAIGATVMSTEQGAKAVEVGMKRSQEAGETIRVLADGVTASAHASVQILASSNEQLIGMDQVAMAMENIKRASEQNAAGIRQAEIAAHDLNTLGQTLKQLIEQYRV